MSSNPLLKFDIRSVPSHPEVFVSDAGIVYRRRQNVRNVLLPRKQYMSFDGYFVISIRKDGKSIPKKVHRFVAEAFHGRPERRQVARHLDGSRTNNRPENLRWGTYSENTQDMWAHGTMVIGEAVKGAKLNPEKAVRIRLLAALGMDYGRIARMFGITRGHATDIATGKRWKWLYNAEIPG